MIDHASIRKQIPAYAAVDIAGDCVALSAFGRSVSIQDPSPADLDAAVATLGGAIFESEHPGVFGDLMMRQMKSQMSGVPMAPEWQPIFDRYCELVPTASPESV